jgi:hypothetical protein
MVPCTRMDDTIKASKSWNSFIWYINHLKQSCRKQGRRLTPCFVFLISSGFQQTLVLFKAHSLGFFDKRALTCIVRSWEIMLPLRSTNSQFPFCLGPYVTWSYCIFHSGCILSNKFSRMQMISLKKNPCLSTNLFCLYYYHFFFIFNKRQNTFSN